MQNILCLQPSLYAGTVVWKCSSVPSYPNLVYPASLSSCICFLLTANSKGGSGLLLGMMGAFNVDQTYGSESQFPYPTHIFVYQTCKWLECHSLYCMVCTIPDYGNAIPTSISPPPPPLDPRNSCRLHAVMKSSDSQNAYPIQLSDESWQDGELACKIRHKHLTEYIFIHLFICAVPDAGEHGQCPGSRLPSQHSPGCFHPPDSWLARSCQRAICLPGHAATGLVTPQRTCHLEPQHKEQGLAIKSGIPQAV